VIDSGERYAWRFPGAAVTTRKLPAGDYALLDGERIAAVVERKSFDNLLGDLGAIQALHHALAHLGQYAWSALVVEAQYADFIDEKRLEGRWPAAFVARALAELTVMHPRLPIVFAGNRKLANQWTHRFFVACAAHRASPQLTFVREARRAAATRRSVRWMSAYAWRSCGRTGVCLSEIRGSGGRAVVGAPGGMSREGGRCAVG
jgi:hypothetical protein